MSSLGCVVCGHIGMINKEDIIAIYRPIILCSDCSSKYRNRELTDDELTLIEKQQNDPYGYSYKEKVNE